jgi:hypothetical protein
MVALPEGLSMHLDLLRALYWCGAGFAAVFFLFPALIDRSARADFAPSLRFTGYGLGVASLVWLAARLLHADPLTAAGTILPNLVAMILFSALFIFLGRRLDPGRSRRR